MGPIEFDFWTPPISTTGQKMARTNNLTKTNASKGQFNSASKNEPHVLKQLYRLVSSVMNTDHKEGLKFQKFTKIATDPTAFLLHAFYPGWPIVL